jgi:hypothetical protein
VAAVRKNPIANSSRSDFCYYGTIARPIHRVEAGSGISSADCFGSLHDMTKMKGDGGNCPVDKVLSKVAASVGR